MFGFNIDDITRGYSDSDDYISRDLLLIELLIDKGIITTEEINKCYKKLPDKIKETKEIRLKEAKKELEKYRQNKN